MTKCFGRSMDRTAVSGTANAGSIPVRSANATEVVKEQEMGKRKLIVLFQQYRMRYGGDACPACFFMPENKKDGLPIRRSGDRPIMLYTTNGVPAPLVIFLYATEVISLTSLRQFTWSVVRPSSVCLYRWSAFVCLRPAPRIIIHTTVSAPRFDYWIFASLVTYAHLVQSRRLCSPALCYRDLLHPGKPLGDI